MKKTPRTRCFVLAVPALMRYLLCLETLGPGESWAGLYPNQSDSILSLVQTR